MIFRKRRSGLFNFYFPIALAFAVSLLIGKPVLADPDVYILNTSTGAPYATKDRTGFQDLIITEVFRRIGLKAQVEIYDASARALINANENIDHGVTMRIKGLEKKFPNLIRVEEPLIANNFVAYSTGIKLTTDNWKSLEPYVVAYINGWLIFERNLAPGQEKQLVKEPHHMFSMLEEGRIDFVLYEQWQGLQRAKDTGIKVNLHEPPLASVDMYMYVHKDYARLAPLLSEALRKMKADGTYQGIFERTLSSLLPKK